MLRRSGLTQEQKQLVQSQCGATLEESKVEEAMYYLFGQDYRGRVGPQLRYNNHQHSKGKKRTTTSERQLRPTPPTMRTTMKKRPMKLKKIPSALNKALMMRMLTMRVTTPTTLRMMSCSSTTRTTTLTMRTLNGKNATRPTWTHEDGSLSFETTEASTRSSLWLTKVLHRLHRLRNDLYHLVEKERVTRMEKAKLIAPPHLRRVMPKAAERQHCRALRLPRPASVVANQAILQRNALRSAALHPVLPHQLPRRASLNKDSWSTSK